MLQKMIDRILALAPIQTFELKGRMYTKNNLSQITPPEFVHPEPLTLNTLSGMVDYVNSLDARLKKVVFLQVDAFNSISLLGELQPENSNKRFKYAKSVLSVNAFGFSNPQSPIWYDLENFVIALQSQFVRNESIEVMLGHLGNLANETVVTHTDDTLSQSIQIETGITTRSSVKVTNPVTLQPHRTFLEVTQPESTCIFRLKSKGGMQCALFISDGGAWKLDAINNIKEWLREQLPEIGIIA